MKPYEYRHEEVVRRIVKGAIRYSNAPLATRESAIRRLNNMNDAAMLNLYRLHGTTAPNWIRELV